MRSFARVAGLALSCATVFAAGCGGGGGSSSGGMGTLSVNLTDAPVDSAAEVVVAFNGIELHHTDGQTVSIDFGTTKTIDLIKLQNGVTGALTDGSAVPAGNYDWMRLKVLADKNTQGQSYIKLTTGEQFPLWIPSGAETGLKLVRPFTVAQGSTTRLVIDFDLRKSITAPPGQDPNYVMRPALRLLDQLQVGKLTANVDLAALAHAQLGATATPASCKAGLYVFSGGTAVPDDQDGDNTNGASPVLYQPIPFDGTNTLVPINIAFLEAATYTVAATCNFDVDAADTDDFNPTAAQGQSGYQTMHWTAVSNVAITANTTTTITVP